MPTPTRTTYSRTSVQSTPETSAVAPLPSAQASIDIFCRVIDNYGDIGVCWRLACNLLQTIHTYPDLALLKLITEVASQHQLTSSQALAYSSSENKIASAKQERQPSKSLPLIRLWVDDLKSFQRILPLVDAQLSIQTLGINHNNQVAESQIIGFIQIHAWQVNLSNEGVLMSAHLSSSDEPASHHYPSRNDISSIPHQPLSTITPAPISIEAFACELDPNYIASMPGHTKYWFNLEYLSAEDWVDSFHAQASLQNNGVAKYFFFPGFTQGTGGLLRETDLINRLDDFLHNPQAQADWLNQYMGEDVCQAWQDGTRLMSFFSYPHAPIESLFKALLASEDRYILLMPHGVVPEAEDMLAALLKHQSPYSYPLTSQTKEILKATDKIRIHRFEFIEQYQFDYLLSLCDINFVRGEDSFVRAIWAAKPFVWHIYPQEEQAHLDKLCAWLDSYSMPNAYRELLVAWNRNAPADIETCQGILTDFFSQASVRHDLQGFAREYRDFLLQNPTLSFSLLSFQPKNT